MSHVNVTINGRQYRMACEDGQEEHLRRLAEEFDQRISGLRSSFGEIGDMRLTVMAALTLADELFEANRRVGELEQELAVLRQRGAAAAEHAQATQAAVVAALNAASERIENVTRSLNQSLATGLPIG
ncbi:MAG: cell division protein ZapA [Variibacter sp.]|nr:cell division protein ZapA [Variibacter sp.]